MEVTPFGGPLFWIPCCRGVGFEVMSVFEEVAHSLQLFVVPVEGPEGLRGPWGEPLVGTLRSQGMCFTPSCKQHRAAVFKVPFSRSV